MAGKGSTPRPRQVSREEYERRWRETFGPSYSEGGDVLATARARKDAQIKSGVWRFPVFDGYITNDGDHPIEINGRTIAAGERVRVS